MTDPLEPIYAFAEVAWVLVRAILEPPAEALGVPVVATGLLFVFSLVVFVMLVDQIEGWSE